LKFKLKLCRHSPKYHLTKIPTVSLKKPASLRCHPSCTVPDYLLMTVDFAHRMFDAARTGNSALLLQAIDGGLPVNLTNDKG
jgi:hypothetical protein